MIFGKTIRPNKFEKTQVPLERPKRLKFIAQPKINLQSFKNIPDSLKQRFEAFERKPSLGAPDMKVENFKVLGYCRSCVL